MEHKDIKVMSLSDERKMRELHAKAVTKMEHDIHVLIGPEMVYKHALKVRKPVEDGFSLETQELIDSVFEEVAPMIKEPPGACLGCEIAHRVSEVFWSEVQDSRLEREKQD